jgi:hypothetical protein
MDLRVLGLWLVIIGSITAVIGLLVYFDLFGVVSGRGLLGWFGRLPGDIRLEGANSRVYIPITSMLIVSVVVTVVVNVIRRLF